MEAYGSAAIAAVAVLMFVVALLLVAHYRRLERQRAKNISEELSRERLANIERFVS